jgi:ABC-2 type transport system ATP-binding protein
MALVADHLIVVGRGRLLADTTVQDLVRHAGGDTVTVASEQPAGCARSSPVPGVEITGEVGSEELHVTGLTARAIGSRPPSTASRSSNSARGPSRWSRRSWT